MLKEIAAEIAFDERGRKAFDVVEDFLIFEGARWWR